MHSRAKGKESMRAPHTKTLGPRWAEQVRRVKCVVVSERAQCHDNFMTACVLTYPVAMRPNLAPFTYTCDLGASAQIRAGRRLSPRDSRGYATQHGLPTMRAPALPCASSSSPVPGALSHADLALRLRLSYNVKSHYHCV
jgi:hypothetical protein